MLLLIAFPGFGSHDGLFLYLLEHAWLPFLLLRKIWVDLHHLLVDCAHVYLWMLLILIYSSIHKAGTITNGTILDVFLSLVHGWVSLLIVNSIDDWSLDPLCASDLLILPWWVSLMWTLSSCSLVSHIIFRIVCNFVDDNWVDMCLDCFYTGHRWEIVQRS